MREASVKVVNPLGLHARPAAQLVKLASKFKSRITITEPKRKLTAEGRSILNVLALSASVGTELLLRADGEDEAEAVDALAKLFDAGFGED